MINLSSGKGSRKMSLGRDQTIAMIC